MKDHAPGSLLYPVYFISFIGGLAQCFESIFLPEFKEYFHLTYTSQMYALFAKNIPFLCFSVLIGFITQKTGFKNCLVISMLLFSAGSFLMLPGLHAGNYTLILLAFFILGTGFNFFVVAGNPLLAKLGDPAGISSRINVASGLGAIAQIIAPLIITLVIPRSVIAVGDKLPYIKNVFLITACTLLVTAVIFMLIREKHTATQDLPLGKNSNGWAQPKTLMGLAAIFLVIGVESGIFGLYRNYLQDTTIAGMDGRQSQQMYTVYFAVFALGRFAGSYIQKRIAPVITLIVSSVVALLLIVLIMFLHGAGAVAAITGIGFFISVFFPTLYAVSIEGLGGQMGKASGLLAMGFLGAAVLPVLQGWLADKTSLQLSFGIAIIPYLFMLFFALSKYYNKPLIIA